MASLGNRRQADADFTVIESEAHLARVFSIGWWPLRVREVRGGE